MHYILVVLAISLQELAVKDFPTCSTILPTCLVPDVQFMSSFWVHINHAMCFSLLLFIGSLFSILIA